MYCLTSARSLPKRDLVRFEMNAASVAKTEADRRSPVRGLGHHRLELSPAIQDLVDPVLLPAAVGIAVKDTAALQIPDGPIELATVLENRRQAVQGHFVVTGFGIAGDRLVDLDRVELVRKLEPLDSSSQPGDRFVVLERVEHVGVRHVERAPRHDRCQTAFRRLSVRQTD